MKPKEKAGEASGSFYSTSSSESKNRHHLDPDQTSAFSNQYLAPKTVKKHRKLYLKSDGTWINDDTECSEAGKECAQYQIVTQIINVLAYSC